MTEIPRWSVEIHSIIGKSGEPIIAIRRRKFGIYLRVLFPLVRSRSSSPFRQMNLVCSSYVARDVTIIATAEILLAVEAGSTLTLIENRVSLANFIIKMLEW